MKILLLSPFFYPEPISTGKYNSYLASELAKNNCSVDVLCSNPLYPKWKIEPTDKQLNGSFAHRGGKYIKYPSHPLLRRVVLELWFFFYACFFMLRKGRQYNLILPVFPPSLFMLCIPFLKGKKSKVIGIVHDLQGIYAGNKLGFITRIIQKVISTVEKSAFKACDKLVFLSEAMRQVCVEHYALDSLETSMFYPFITIDQFVDQNNLADIMPNSKTKPMKTVVYSGALGEKQAPYKLAELMAKAKAIDPEIVPYIFSQGPIFEALKNNDQYKSVNFHPLVPEEDLPELLMRSGVQILPQDTGTSDGSLPSKLPNLLASECKIFCITDDGSELVTLLSGHKKYKVCTHWNTDVLAKDLCALVNNQEQVSVSQELLNKFKLNKLVDYILS